MWRTERQEKSPRLGYFQSPMRNIFVVVTLLWTIGALSGCGSGTSSDVRPSAPTTAPPASAPTQGSIAVTMTFAGSAGTPASAPGRAANRASQAGIPSNAAAFTIWLLNPSNGQLLLAPITGTRNGQATQTVVIPNVPHGSMDVLVAFVDASGTIVCFANTTATVLGGRVTALLIATPLNLSSITVSPPSPTIGLQTTQAFSATATFSDNSTAPIGSLVTWSSSDKGVATISALGVATGLTSGTSTVGAAFFGVSGSTEISVDPLISITVTAPSSSLPKGTSEQVTATGTFASGATQNLTTQVAWSTNPTGFATVTAAGVATGVAVGQTHVVATLGTLTGQETVNVTLPVVSLQITPPQAMLQPAATLQYKAIATFSDQTMQDVTASVAWSSSDTQTATFSTTTNGLATVVGTDPTATVTASIQGVKQTATLNVGEFLYTAPFRATEVTFAQVFPFGNVSTPSTFLVGNSETVTGLAMDPFGTVLYELGNRTQVVVAQPIEGTPGAGQGASTGTATSSSSLGYAPSDAVVLPNDSAIMVLSSSYGTVGFYAITPQGTVGPQIGTTFAVSDLRFGTSAIAVDPLGRFVCVANFDGNGFCVIETFQITYAADGTVSSVATSSSGEFQTVFPDGGAAIDPTGSFLFVGANDVTGNFNQVSAFSLSSTGVPTHLQDYTLSAASGQVTTTAVALTPTGDKLIAASENSVEVFSQSNGALTALGTSSTNQQNPLAVLSDASEQTFEIVDYGNGVQVFSLTTNPPVALGSQTLPSNLTKAILSP